MVQKFKYSPDVWFHEKPSELIQQMVNNYMSGISCLMNYIANMTSRLAFQLLQNDSDARLVMHMHGAGGTVGSGYRVPNYRALSAGDPKKIHVLTFDYRGFGYSTGTPSEKVLITDAISVIDWAINVAHIPPFAHFSILFNYLKTFIQDQWLSADRLTQYVRANEANRQPYYLNIIHAKDDYDIPWHHSSLLFWHAVNASILNGISYEALELKKEQAKRDLGVAGSSMEWRTANGMLREDILKYDFHDVIMGFPVITMAIMRTFETHDSIKPFI
jgi:abhydrolase domain-containing protein 12